MKFATLIKAAVVFAFAAKAHATVLCQCTFEEGGLAQYETDRACDAVGGDVAPIGCVLDDTFETFFVQQCNTFAGIIGVCYPIAK